MHPSVRTLALVLATLAIGDAQGFKFQRRADAVDTSSFQGVQNLLITNAEQAQFYIPMQFGSGNGSLTIYGLVSTTRGDIVLPNIYAKDVTGFVSQGKSVDQGPVYAGPVSAVGWRMLDQEIIYYQNSDPTLPLSVTANHALAGFGIWPNTSKIAQSYGDWSADSFIARILTEPDTGLYWTLLINPVEEDEGIDQSFGGILTIGEIANVAQIFNVTQQDLHESNFPDLTLVTEYPKLNNSASHNGEYYYALIDAISWGSGSATLKSSIPGIPDGKIAAYVDSTSPWNQVPYSITEQLYKDLEGATYVEATRMWNFKCTELTINITIAGHDYPLSPLTAARHIYGDGLNCIGTFQAIPDNAADVVLGVPFLKNVYARFSYATDHVDDPYVQLMPITNIEDAHNDWETWSAKWGGSSSKSSSAVRPTPNHSSLSTPLLSSSFGFSSHVSASPTTLSGHPSPSIHSSSLPFSSPVSASSSASGPLATGGDNRIAGAVEDDDTEEKTNPVARLLPAIIVGSVLLGLALICGVVFLVRRIRNGRDGKGAYRGLGTPNDGVGPVKVPLYDTEGAGSRYGEGGQGRYTDPYKD